MIGSALIGQEFTSDRYFHGRPSATIGPDPADPDQDHLLLSLQRRELDGIEPRPDQQGADGACQGDVEKLKAENPSAPVPIDLVTTTGSGLDLDISPEAALFQVPRVAKARNIPETQVRQLVDANVRGRMARHPWRTTNQRTGTEHGARPCDRR